MVNRAKALPLRSPKPWMYYLVDLFSLVFKHLTWDHDVAFHSGEHLNSLHLWNVMTLGLASKEQLLSGRSSWEDSLIFLLHWISRVWVPFPQVLEQLFQLVTNQLRIVRWNYPRLLSFKQLIESDNIDSKYVLKAKL